MTTKKNETEQRNRKQIKKRKKVKWKSWGEFLGTGSVSLQLRKFRSYEETKQYARSQNINTKKDWLNHTKSKKFPKDNPVSLLVYDEWVNSKEFFGKRQPHQSNSRSI